MHDSGPLLRVSNPSRGAVLGDRVKAARSFWARLRGLQFTDPLGSGEGLWLLPAGSIHTCCMRYALDLVFLDEAGTVVALRCAVAPWRIIPAVHSARSCLELPPGTVAGTGTRVGDRLAWGDAGAGPA